MEKSRDVRARVGVEGSYIHRSNDDRDNIKRNACLRLEQLCVAGDVVVVDKIIALERHSGRVGIWMQ